MPAFQIYVDSFKKMNLDSLTSVYPTRTPLQQPWWIFWHHKYSHVIGTFTFCSQRFLITVAIIYIYIEKCLTLCEPWIQLSYLAQCPSSIMETMCWGKKKYYCCKVNLFLTSPCHFLIKIHILGCKNCIYRLFNL